MVNATRKLFITPEESLATERTAEFKSEFYDGVMYAMTGTSHEHNVINANWPINLYG